MTSEAGPESRQSTSGQEEGDGDLGAQASQDANGQVGHAESRDPIHGTPGVLEIGTEVELLDPDDLLEKVVERVDQRIEHRIEACMVETFSGSDHALSPSQIKAIDECSDGLKSAIIDTYRDSVASAIYVQKGSLDLKKKDQKDSVRLLYGGLILAGVVEFGLIHLLSSQF